jgi:forkhead box protein O3
MSPSYQQNEASPSLPNQQQTIHQYLMQHHQQQSEQQKSQQQPQTQQQTSAVQAQSQVPSGNSSPDSPIPSTMMGQLMGALNNTALLDDLNINIETLHGFDCDIDEVRFIKCLCRIQSAFLIINY